MKKVNILSAAILLVLASGAWAQEAVPTKGRVDCQTVQADLDKQTPITAKINADYAAAQAADKQSGKVSRKTLKLRKAARRADRKLKDLKMALKNCK